MTQDGGVWVAPRGQRGSSQGECVLPTFCSGPLADAEPRLGAGRGRTPISMCTQARELQEAPMVGFQGGFVKTLGGVCSLQVQKSIYVLDST